MIQLSRQLIQDIIMYDLIMAKRGKTLVGQQSRYTYTINGVNETYGSERLISAGKSLDEVVKAYQKLVTLNRGLVDTHYLEVRQWLNGSVTRNVYGISPVKVTLESIKEKFQQRYGDENEI
ncbi:hypothetical protein PHYNN_171 [Pantoea phage Phynn]|nr:hypothetical protein PHYNN_171 [Pantoea phage Phynn]